jgi:aminodeoxyfutalosine deaminase
MPQSSGSRHSALHPELLLRARVVVPVAQPPIKDGAVAISGTRIAGVGTWRELSTCGASEVRDLGEVILLPGLVNAHCHLDYTNMAGLFPPQRRFTDWVKLLTATKADWGYSDFAESWLKGAKMLVNTGTTTVGDIESLPELLPEVWDATPLRVFSFLEMTGVKSRRQPRAILREVIDRIGELSSSRCLAGLSPHSPYATLPELLRLSADAARRRGWRLCMHLAESPEEYEMFVEARGDMFEWLRRSERNMSDCGLGSPIEHLQRNGVLGDNLLAVHVNYLAQNDAALLGRHKVSVVHCPRSHAYFSHDAFPLGQLTRAGVNVCLGTDSLASVLKRGRQKVELNFFEDVRVFAAANSAVSPKTIVGMATQNAARALGLEGEVGELAPHAFADLITLPFTGKTADVYEAIIGHQGHVTESMIDGQWAVALQGRPAGVEARLQPV